MYDMEEHEQSREEWEEEHRQLKAKLQHDLVGGTAQSLGYSALFMVIVLLVAIGFLVVCASMGGAQ